MCVVPRSLAVHFSPSRTQARPIPVIISHAATKKVATRPFSPIERERDGQPVSAGRAALPFSFLTPARVGMRPATRVKGEQPSLLLPELACLVEDAPVVAVALIAVPLLQMNGH
ncbi:hypothetical protein K505DRAFT_365904 [Melanomma pulvis-pyrius CBS 109.77]|uniref:Uncharacterized protein n=1 Tax=Melanomma pulvis-pyrius CBS 109.77 TaxID=1314802 RepID=A0A6A6WYV7_9PLEO|nr:hypothetical protein K505DRAFT_365904 [Melanomma pulvis-pyrius CBS 109.77]